MILSPNSLSLLELQKQLPKKKSHQKEALKIKFIQQLMLLYRQNHQLKAIDFEKSVYTNDSWNIHFQENSRTHDLPETVASVMEKWYFSNLSKNENIYFYRFLNIFRSLMSPEEWVFCQSYLLEHPDLNLKENTRVYCDYRRKLDEIEQMIKGK